jgi:hypothetical protein
MNLGTLVSDFKADAEKVKSFIQKIAGDAPAVVAAVAADEAKIAPVVEAFLPGATAAITTTNNVMDAVAQAVENAGTAAGSSGLSVPIDQALVSSVKNVIASAKSAKASSIASAAPAAGA